MTYNINIKWLLIIIAVIILITIVITFTNSIFYYNIKTGTCAALSPNTATILTWSNIIITIILVIVFILLIWYLVNISSKEIVQI